ncbi:ROK family transcriptional regulator [Krasilnikoviella flava]|uniref:Sugar kinase of the NBD/HSP70 family, may contain an N-terminal HTH domain n=1 Tax=Krasilnikoviella flava TaxID=526729 RepID=A0A1T5LXL4_9MICO|nr:ROK family transcriptional regulator [Krasilnikoviella flava]SKC80574.1 Sugar kinase of the NBD/HSP70 family, may contain an N-terminal HTH domain [Krasilnikoviella flava]
MMRKSLSVNERMVLDLLLERQSASRATISKATGLSKPSTGDLVVRLVEAGLVTPVGEVSSAQRGPNAVHFRAVTDLCHVAGVEMQPGRFVHAVVSDLSGAALSDVRIPQRGDDPVETVAEAVAAACAEAGIEPSRLWQVLAGTPGVVNPQGDMDFVSGHPAWRAGQRGRLAARLGCPVALENDVNLAALAEAESGNAAGIESFTLLRLDEGIGAATVVNRTLLRGAHGYAGEIGLAPTTGGGPLGSSSAGFQSLVGSAALQEVLDGLGLDGTSPEQALRDDDPGDGLRAFRREAARRVAVVVTTIATVVDPHRVVLAGTVGTAGAERFAAEVEELLRAESPLRTEVVASSFGPGGVVRGALTLLREAARESVYGIGAVAAPVRTWPELRGP